MGGRATRDKLRREAERHLVTERRQRTMRTDFLTKALRPDGTKTHPGQDVFSERVAVLALTDQEIHETGLAIARAAEAAEGDKPWRVAMRQAGLPTKEEADELSAAIEAAEPFSSAVAAARIGAELAAEDAQRRLVEGYWEGGAADERAIARARAASAAAELALKHAIEEAAHADLRVRAARGAISRGGQARAERFVLNGGLDG